MGSPLSIIIGLGNPGPEYAATRHNAGAQCVTAICQQLGASLKADKKLFGSLAQTHGQNTIRLFIPTTYMNDSGKAVSAVLNFYKIPPQQALIIHDEIDLPLGCVRFKANGGHGGNNGLRSIIKSLGTQDFPRLRIGIGHPGHKDQVSDYVLNKPSRAEQQQLEQAIDHAIAVLPQLIQGEWQQAMLELHSP